MKRVVCVFSMFAFFQAGFPMIVEEGTYAMGGCYMYTPAYGEMFHRTPGYLCGDVLNKTLDRLLADPKTVTSEEMVNIKTQLEAFVAGINAVLNTAPDQAVSLSNMYCGIIAKIKNLYDSNQDDFINAVNEMEDGKPKIAFKETLRGIGITTDGKK